jgi:glycosyltransferase involved in cell wall biosynthesis
MTSPLPQVLVINFNAPELNQLAGALARSGSLKHFVRPYVNKGRLWERALQALPLGGSAYEQTLGRRRLDEPALAALTKEAGVPFDWCSALVGRALFLPDPLRHRWTNALHQQVRHAVAKRGQRLVADIDCVVAYEGFALPAFEAVQRGTGVHKLLNYPVAHHRQRRQIREEELALEPDFASTWPGFDDWGPGHEDRLDREIELADTVLLGSSFAADSFVAAGIPRSKLQVVPYGVDSALFLPPAEPVTQGDGHAFKVIYAGQLTQRKGLSYLLRGYAAFRRADTELTLVGARVGGPEPLHAFEQLFVHVPHQTRQALAQRYRNAHVFVFPTLVEGMPLVVLEAMACGLPVIVTANGPAGIVRDGVDGFIVPQRSALAVTEKLELLYRNPELRISMGRNAAVRAREFSWQAYANGVMQHLQARGTPTPQPTGAQASGFSPDTNIERANGGVRPMA